jgi:hypothetical protein
MKWSALLLIITLSACKSKGPVCIINASDIGKGGNGKLIILKDSGNKITAMYDAGWDSLKGGAYIFYPNQQLKSYTFYQSRVAVYNETYDDQGHLVHTQGSPMVDRVINELGLDSAYVQVYFYSVIKTYQQLNIKINNNAAVNYILRNDTSYSNMKSITFGITTSDLTRINMYSRIKYFDNCTEIEHILSDSLFLLKDPHIEPAPPRVK